jgi:hypothetical protein
MIPRKLIAVALAAIVVGAVAGAAVAAPNANNLTGVWSGKTHQDLPPLGEDDDFVEWEQRIVVQAYHGRLVSVTTNLRYTCPHPTNPLAGDVRLEMDWRLGRGPLLSKKGGFALKVTRVRNTLTGRVYRLPVPVSLYGILGTGSGSGRFELSSATCSGKGTWRALRTSKI